MLPAPPRIAVLGDSHSAFFFKGGMGRARLGLPDPAPWEVVGRSISGASVAGFRPGNGRLDVKAVVRDQLPLHTHMVLAFGQVDLELGYYYRLVVKGEQVSPAAYVAWLAGIYRDFLADLDLGACDVALKGVNPTALGPKHFSARYVSRIVLEQDADEAAAIARVLPHVLSQDEQNAMHYAFNAELASLADDLGIRYFDLVPLLTEPHPSGGPARLSDLHRRAAFDHHVANTVWMRRKHYEAAGTVFGLADEQGPASVRAARAGAVTALP